MDKPQCVEDSSGELEATATLHLVFGSWGNREDDL